MDFNRGSIRAAIDIFKDETSIGFCHFHFFQNISSKLKLENEKDRHLYNKIKKFYNNNCGKSKEQVKSLLENLEKELRIDFNE